MCVTGAGSGIGAATALAFARDVTDMVLLAKGEEGLARVEEQLRQQNPCIRLLSIPVDLALEENCVAAMRQVRGFLETHLDILVNNVGAFLPTALEDPKLAQHIAHLFALNTMSAVYCTRALLPILSGGHIFNVSSVAALEAYPSGMAYGISKYALKGFSDNLRMELRAQGIKVTTLLPGATWTKSWEDAGVDPSTLMEASDVAQMIYAAARLSRNAVVEEIVMRPMKVISA